MHMHRHLFATKIIQMHEISFMGQSDLEIPHGLVYAKSGARLKIRPEKRSVLLYIVSRSDVFIEAENVRSSIKSLANFLFAEISHSFSRQMLFIWRIMVINAIKWFFCLTKVFAVAQNCLVPILFILHLFQLLLIGSLSDFNVFCLHMHFYSFSLRLYG